MSSSDEVLARLADAHGIRVRDGFVPRSRRFRTPENLELHYLDGPGDVALERAKILYRHLHMTHSLLEGSLAWRADRRRPHDFPHTFAKLEELAVLAPRMPLPVLVVRGGCRC